MSQEPLDDLLCLLQNNYEFWARISTQVTSEDIMAKSPTCSKKKKNY